MRHTIIVAWAVGLWSFCSSCSLVLDTDVLQNENNNGSTDTDSELLQTCNEDGDCEDNVDCTYNDCSSNGLCVFLPNNSLCDPLEYCDPNQGCVPSGDECVGNSQCDDGIECTVDECVLGVCRNTPDHTVCEDPTLLCITGAQCVAGTGCMEGHEVVCNQPNEPCRDASCDPTTGECVEHWMDGADNDSDNYLDDACGGNDCNDENSEEFPGAVEYCNDRDSNCDSYVDVSFQEPFTTAYSGNGLSNPKMAYDGTHYGILWQQDTTTLIHFMGDDGSPLTLTPFDLSTLGTTGQSHTHAALTAGSAGFYVIWIAADSDSSVTLNVVHLTLSGNDIIANTPIELATDGATQIISPQIKYDSIRSDDGWLAVWGQTTSGIGQVMFQAHDMPDSSLEVFAEIGTVEHTSLAVVDDKNYAVAFAGDFPSQSQGNTEVFESHIIYDTEFGNGDGFPRLVSVSDDSVADISNEPAVASNGQGGWTIAYADNSGYGTAINVWDTTKNIRVVNQTGYEPSDISWWYGGDTWALLYTNTSLVAATLEFEQFSTGLNIPDDKIQSTRLLLAEEVNDVWLQDAHMAKIANQSYGVVWVWQDNTIAQQYIQYSTVQSCVP